MSEKIQANELLSLLADALYCKDKHKRKEYLSRFEELVGEYDISDVNKEQLEALEDLANDYAYYSIDQDARREDPALFGDDEMEKRIRETFKRGNWRQYLIKS